MSLRELAEAAAAAHAKGDWHPVNYQDVCTAYIAAASPDVTLQLLDRLDAIQQERDELRALLTECVAVFDMRGSHGPLVDEARAALAASMAGIHEPVYLWWSEIPDSGAEVTGWGGADIYKCRACHGDPDLQLEGPDPRATALEHLRLHDIEAAVRDVAEHGIALERQVANAILSNAQAGREVEEG